MLPDRIDCVLIKSQQAYFAKLGFYSGLIDGIWGPESKAAMEKFKKDKKFKPANIRRGDGPFVPFERLPAGFEWEILDGQRCILETANLPKQFIFQELVNLLTKPKANTGAQFQKPPVEQVAAVSSEAVSTTTLPPQTSQKEENRGNGNSGNGGQNNSHQNQQHNNQGKRS